MSAVANKMASETDPLLARREELPTKSYTKYVVGALSVCLIAGVGYHVYGTQSSDIILSEWNDRSDAWKGKQTCTSCAVVMPSPILAGKGFGPAIDQHDCVVRFNAHYPDLASTDDWGAKDNLRVMNGDNGAYGVMKREAENPTPCFDKENPQCRRVIVTWNNPDIQGFMAEHSTAELMGNAAANILPLFEDCNPSCDINAPLKESAARNGLRVPEYGSTAYDAIFFFRHPLMCGDTLTIYGVPSKAEEDNDLYIDDHQGGNPAENHLAEHQFYREVTDGKHPGWETVKLQEM